MEISLKKIQVFLVFLSILLGCTVIYVILNPPLSTSGASFDENQRNTVVELGNDGFGSVSLRMVYVNDGETPASVELGVSSWGQLVLGGALDESPHITFHDIGEYNIRPALSPEEASKKLDEIKRTGEKNTIFHYGLRIRHDKPIQSVTIKYSYFWIPLSHTRDIKKDV